MRLLLIISLCFCSCLLLANEGVPAPKITPSFKFDGKVNQLEWADIPPIDLIVQTPVYHGEPTQETVIKLAYDEDYIYLSGALYDDEPEKILANNKLRDGGDESTEWFGLVIDSYNDKQNALSFFTTPTGSRFDAAILNDANGRNPMNLSWNNFWDVKTSITEEGWFAEMRIPFSSLQYQVIDDKVVMGITIWRYIARNNELHISPDISPDLGEMGGFRPSQAKEYVFENVKQKKPFYITPYVLSGFNNIQSINAGGTAYEADRKILADAGLDVKLGLKNNYTLDLSVNTDFAQVEADDQQINLTRFSLFFPEKRLFFQERSGIFDFSFGSRNNLFYSRRIGIDSDGNTIPILGGARLTGRSGGLDVGVISMQTQKTDEFLSNNYSVLRLKKQVINENSQVGFLFTNNVNSEGIYNAVYGFDSSIRILKDDFLTFKFAQSFSSGIEPNLASVDPSLFWMSMSRRTEKGFTYGASISRLGTDFNSELGFIERSDYTRLGTRVQYNWFPGEASSFLRHGVSLRGVSFWENTGNTYNSCFYGLGYNWQWKNGIRLELGMRLQYDDITEAFELANVALVPVDQYLYNNVQLEFGTRTGRPYIFRGELSSGQFFDGYRHSMTLSPVWNVSPGLGLSADYEFNNVVFQSRSQEFTAHIARVKAQLMFSTKFSISSFIQYNSLDHLFLGNIRIRYNPREGNDLFIVYNTDANSQRNIYEPRLPATNQSSLIVKYSYTFTL
ncbi:DUF5916 domain-containing protein [Portibacter marinus]|uniref:DUF5916 domain-containing protein n=1 Tax=Portibacter marinus TaxID=2898660 RepID=UPI001F452D14|nr:DUF5916 domain-containing protein [Portibacter marinus]